MLNSRLELLFKYTCLYSNTLSIRIKRTGLLVWRRMDCYNTLQIKLQKIINNYTHFKTHFSCCTQSLLVRYHMFARDLIQIRCIKCLHLVDTCSNVSSVWWCGSCGLKQLRRLSIASRTTSISSDLYQWQTKHFQDVRCKFWSLILSEWHSM